MRNITIRLNGLNEQLISNSFSEIMFKNENSAFSEASTIY